MKKTILIFIMIILSFTNMSHAADKWDKEEITVATIFTVATVIDWGQTRDMAKSNWIYHIDHENHTIIYYEEINPILGKKPSLHEIDTYFTLATISTLTISHYLPKDWRKKFLSIMSFIEFHTIHNNHNIGLKINF